jgi:hypothetical protein
MPVSGHSSKKICFAEKTKGAETCSTHHQGNEVALEADALYIRVGNNQILGRPFLPCSILSGDYVSELLAEAKELTLFADIICATKDSSHATIGTDLLLHWHDNISMPLQMPGRIRMRLLASPLEESKSSNEG